MNAPVQAVSQLDRQRAIAFARQLQITVEKCGVIESSTEILTREYQNQCGASPTNGFPLLACIDIPVRQIYLAEYARQLIALFCSQISEKFHNINCLISAGECPEESVARLAQITLKGSGEALAILGRELGLELEILAFYSVYLVRPIRLSVARLASDRGLFSDWKYGYCPACGLWGRMGQIDAKEGDMHLWCIGCGLRWTFPRMCCPFCLERRPERLGFLLVDESDLFRVYTCDSCRRYVKTVVATAGDAIEFDAEYLTTSRFDITAAYEGYVQDFVGYTAFDMKDNAASRAYRQKALS